MLDARIKFAEAIERLNANGWRHREEAGGG